MSTRKIRLKKTLAVRVISNRLHALWEGEELEVNDLPAGNKLPRFWYTDVDGKEIGIYENEAELIDED